MARLYAPAYESGVAVPPQFECVCGQKCDKITDHHNAFYQPDFKKPPGIRKEASRFIIQQFRSSVYNRFWVPWCKHEEIHMDEKRVKRPKLEIMEAFIEEAAILRHLDEAHIGLDWSARRIGNWSPRRDKRRLDELLERRGQLQEKQEAALMEVETIRFIPEEVVTGALLFSVPEIARQRLAANPNQGVVATRNWPKHRVFEIASRAQAVLPLQTGVDEVELAA